MSTTTHPLPQDRSPTPLRVDPSAVSAKWLDDWLHNATLGEFEAVDHLAALGADVTVGQLRTWRQRGQGPHWVKAGSAALYCLADLQRWARSRETHLREEIPA